MLNSKGGGSATMIDKHNISEHLSIDPDLSVYDIDIDFELTSGKPVWVVILRRKDQCPQSFSDIEEPSEAGTRA